MGETVCKGLRTRGSAWSVRAGAFGATTVCREGGRARGGHGRPRTLPGSGVGEPLAAQERGDPSWLRGLVKYSVRNNGI